MTPVTFENASRHYAGSERPAVDGLDLELADGEFLVLVGPSGCGKTTSLRMLAGLEDLSSGSIRIGEREVGHLPPRERDVAMVFQNYALYPHMTVGENMGFALRIARQPAAEIRRRVQAAAATLGLTEFLDRRPRALSGGQRQRVAMGRAIVREPQVFLMDEPLSNLDATLRTSTRSQIAALQRRLGVTTLYVTHDQVEAMTMGDRVAVLHDGRLQQCATPVELYHRPANAFVAGFIGSPAMNLHELPVVDGELRIQDHGVPVTREELTALRATGATSGLLGFRPESVEPTTPGSGFEVVVTLVEDLGSEAFLYGRFPGLRPEDAPEYDVVARLAGVPSPAVGETVHLRVTPRARHLFSPTTGDRVDP